jgi:tRNA-2-methylthio-N6-dimethylallyladenosine synthase
MQSGSDRILKKMNRKYTRDGYAAIVEKIRRANPMARISSDFIAGFPGETDDDFEATMDAVREIGFIQSFSFKYSPRPGTPAAAMDGQVAEGVKKERLSRLQSLLREQQDSFNKSCAGRVMEVLFTGAGKGPGEIAGRNEYQQPVIAKAPAELVGTIGRVRIVSGSYANLRGEIV